MYLLDTDILVGFLRNDKNASNKMKSLIESNKELHTSSINIYELVMGAYLSNDPQENLDKIRILMRSLDVLSLDAEIAFTSGRLSAQLKLKGKPIGQNDLLIAAIALFNNLILITRNKKHYEKIENIKIEEW